MVSRFVELRSRLCLCALLLTFIFLLSTLKANGHSEVITDYLYDNGLLCEATPNQPALDYFQENSHFLRSLPDHSEGLCLGMACAYLQAALAGTRPKLGKRLKTCSRNPQSGWHYNDRDWGSLESAVMAALSHYEQFRAASG